MKNQVTIVLALAVLFFSETYAASITFTNNCTYTVWPGTLTGVGPQLSKTGFKLASRESETLDVPSPWTSGRIWARTGCAEDSTGKLICATADCASGEVECKGAGAIPPASLAEFTIAANGGQDFYDISLVDGFNLPISITPQGGTGTNCTSTSCPGDVNAICPPELAVKDSNGAVIACQSACLALNQPQYCCTGAYATPDTCPPTNYSKIFKEKCPQAYSYAYDDKTSTFTCSGGANYLITFCP